VWQRGAITRRDLMRSMPFFAAACVAGIVMIYLQSGGAVSTEVIPIGGPASRFANAGMAVWFYLSKAMCPLNLIPIYQTWKVAPPAWYEFLPLVALIGIFVACWCWHAQAWARAVLVALAYYTMMLLPVLGFVSMSYMRLTLVADHFQYLSLMSIIALVVAAAMRWLPRRAWMPVAAVILMILCGLSWTQAAIYRNEETLWTETLKRNPDMWQAHNLLGVALFKKGDPADKAEAFKHFQRAVELNPENPEVHNNLGLGYATRGQTDQAIEEYKKAISLRDEPAVRTNLAIALGAVQRYAEAEEQYRTALQMDPGNPSRYSNLGYVLMQQQRLEEASEQFRKALQIDPNLPQARQNLSFIRNLQARQQAQH
jgi:Flp pilus assembly protein TadD